MKQTMIAHVGDPGLGGTERRDRWWIQPSLVALGLAVFVVYSTWAALVGTDYRFGPYLSPFYSPYLRPAWFPFSGALFVLWIPLGFRLSCYYYRKAYYRAYLLSPPACAVSEPRRTYTAKPRSRSNTCRSRIAGFSTSRFSCCCGYGSTLRAFDFGGRFGIGAGTLVMLANVVMLSGFTFGCHALRSVVGGNVRCFSCERFGDAR